MTRPAVLNDAYYLEDEDVSDEEDVPVENRYVEVDCFNICNLLIIYLYSNYNSKI